MKFWSYSHLVFLGEDKAETFSRIAALDYEFDEEDFAGISHEAKQFIEQLFTRDPLKRATAKQCLHHDWVIKFSPKNMPEIKVEPVQDRREVMEMERRKQWEEGKSIFSGISRSDNRSRVSGQVRGWVLLRILWGLKIFLRREKSPRVGKRK